MAALQKGGGNVSHQLCQMCHKNPATVHEYIVAEKKENHLCEECYRKLHQQEVTPVIQLEILQKLLFPGAAQEKGTKKKKELVCPFCGMRLSEFKRLGRFGCPDCYGAFAKVLDPILESIHDASRHVGADRPRKQEELTTPGTFRMKKEKLQRALQEAVQKEHYEEAARIRDEIKGLEEEEQEKGETAGGEGES